MQKPLLVRLTATAVGATAALTVFTGPATAAAAPRQVLYVGGPTSERSEGSVSVIDPPTGKDLDTIGGERGLR